jgi:hypothetical protein|tara:strand:+ start:429 stop:758 length:330 start_codon:yes stop_codon:yes gene_type:complete
MRVFKSFIFLSIFLILTNCAAPGTALLGPSFTAATSGSLSQTGLSYGTSHVVKKTKQGLAEIIKTKKVFNQQVDLIYQKIEKDKLSKIGLKDQRDFFFKAVRDNLKKHN